MHSLLRTRALTALLALCSWALVVEAQQTRDGRRRMGTGTSTVTGVVLLDDDVPAPLRRARVMLKSPDSSTARTVIANDEGRFTIDRLPAGRYTLGATKDGYVAVNYGARRPNRPGIAIALRDGETRAVTLRMPRGSVITGTVVDPDGQPARGVLVNAMHFRYVPAAGERQLTRVRSAATDDRGVYRIYGLAAGEYFVFAHAQSSGPPRSGDLQLVSPAEVQRARAELGQRATRSQPGSPSIDAPPGSSAEEPRRSVALAPVFYPSTVDATNAVPITVGRGEERGGIDFQMQYVPTAIVSGTVPAGSNVRSVALIQTNDNDNRGLLRTHVVNAPNGRFQFGGIEPGTYTLFTDTRASGLWGKVEIVVNGEDITGLSLALQPGLTISGRIAFEGATPPPTDLARLRVSLPPVYRRRSERIHLPPVQMQPGGRFTMTGIVPGVYQGGVLMLRAFRSPVGGWWLKSITMEGRELLDAPLDLQRSANDVIVTFSDRATELTGIVRDGDGNPLSDRYLVVFSTHKAAWFPNSRRVAGERPNGDGQYAIRNLPPGEYFVAISEDLEPNEWYDPKVLEQLAPEAMRIVLRENERKKQDWMVAEPVSR